MTSSPGRQPAQPLYPEDRGQWWHIREIKGISVALLKKSLS